MDANPSRCSVCSEVKLVYWLCPPACASVLAGEKFNRNYYALLKKLKQSFSRLSSKNYNREAMRGDCGQQAESLGLQGATSVHAKQVGEAGQGWEHGIQGFVSGCPWFLTSSVSSRQCQSWSQQLTPSILCQPFASALLFLDILRRMWKTTCPSRSPPSLGSPGAVTHLASCDPVLLR
ncbi:uncharacterized protein LOC127481007 [Manacus candei]|uniref:uncharacterized protein LOC127481007 n=1 Tax=Manacus candei TaxID=415023 RepID=UPI002225FC63|nr:uncharacterized protein LOC127481007 [Manacus candei]